MPKEFTDNRLAEHVEGFSQRPAATFGSKHLEDRIADLEKRVTALEPKVVAKGGK